MLIRVLRLPHLIIILWVVFLGSLRPALAGDMQFRLAKIDVPASCGGNCTQLIVAQGEIVPETPREFLHFLAVNLHNRNVRLVLLLNSPGGGVQASIELGRILRRLRFATVVGRAIPSSAAKNKYAIVSGRCYSACVYSFMGGIKRVIPSGSEAGIHRAYTPAVGPDPIGSANGGSGEPRVSINQDFSAEVIARFSRQMGVSLDLLKQAQKVPPTSIHIITATEAKRWHLASQKF